MSEHLNKPVIVNNEHLVLGQANLADFLTNNGFPMSRVNLARLIHDDRGPPAVGKWTNRLAYSPSKALEWAEAHLRSRGHRKNGPRKPKAPKAAMLPTETLPTQRVPIEIPDDMLPPC